MIADAVDPEVEAVRVAIRRSRDAVNAGCRWAVRGSALHLRAHAGPEERRRFDDSEGGRRSHFPSGRRWYVAARKGCFHERAAGTGVTFSRG